MLRNNPDYYAQTNADDLILDHDELPGCARRSASRIVVYDHGGHLGNLGDRQQIADMLEMLAGRWARGAAVRWRRCAAPAALLCALALMSGCATADFSCVRCPRRRRPPTTRRPSNACRNCRPHGRRMSTPAGAPSAAEQAGIGPPLTPARRPLAADL